MVAHPLTPKQCVLQGMSFRTGFRLKCLIRAPIDVMLQSCSVLLEPEKAKVPSSVHSGTNDAFLKWRMLEAAKHGVKYITKQDCSIFILMCLKLGF